MARPKAHSETAVLVKAWIPPADASALNTLVAVTGEAKASHLRRALSQYLATFDLANHTTTSVVTHPITKEKAR